MKPLDLTLYLVLDPDLCGGADGMIRTTLAAVEGGATVVQLRAPTWKKRAVAECARGLLTVLPRHVPLLINDHADVAKAVGAAGVHVGQKDLSPEDCRLILGPEAYIGLSVSNEDELVRRSPEADHLGVGPVFATSTKKDAAPVLGLDRLAAIAAASPVPVVAIGGISAANAADVYATPVGGIAVVSAICGQADPAAATRALRRLADHSVRFGCR